MVIKEFPNPHRSSPEGIIAVGGDLEPESLLLAYSQGIFPWPFSEKMLAWFCPPERAILEKRHLHIPKSLARTRKNTLFKFTQNQKFAEVISACAKISRPSQDGTWITEQMISAYCRLHQLGHAHSIEVWDHHRLVGGIYGVEVNGTFSGESMFHLEPNASKLALLHLMDLLQNHGLDWIDIQVITPHLKILGARMISRDQFLEKLVFTKKLNLKLF